MQTYEYKVIPAPNRSKRVKGVKGTAGRFAAVLTQAMNDLAAEGWEYLRSDSLPLEEKQGLLKGRIETYQTMLVFRRVANTTAETPMAGYIEDQTDVAEPADQQIEPVLQETAEQLETEEPVEIEPVTEEPEPAEEPTPPRPPKIFTR